MSKGDDRPRIGVRLVSRAPVPKPPDDPDAVPYHWDWWDVYGCGQSGGHLDTLAGQVQRGERCGRAGCWSCDRDRLRKVVAAGRIWARAAGHQWSLYTFTLGERDPNTGAMRGKPARTREDVLATLDGWRATILSASRAGLWLGGSWVFEVVPLRGAKERSTIPCPYREAPPEEGPCDCEDGCEKCKDTCVLRGADPRATAAHLLCTAGTCSLCGGTGYLAVGHVHVHALVLGPPAWYADPRDPVQQARHGDRAALEGWHTCPGGDGLLAWAERKGWGRVRRDPIAEADAAARYVSKAASSYAAKGAPSADGAFYSQAYLRSGLDKRTVYAANFGCLYGLRARTADPHRKGWRPGDPEPIRECSAADAAADAVLREVPRVVVVEGDPEERLARWTERNARHLAGLAPEGAGEPGNVREERGAVQGCRGLPDIASIERRGAASGGDAFGVSPSGAPPEAEEPPPAQGRAPTATPDAVREAPPAGAGPVLEVGTGNEASANSRSGELALAGRAPLAAPPPGDVPLSSSTGANCDTAPPGRGGPPSGAGPAVRAACPLVAGPFLQTAHRAEWWEPWVLRAGRWYVGGCAAACAAYEDEGDARVHALGASLARILGVLVHEQADRLADRDEGAGTAALLAWAEHPQTRASFPHREGPALVGALLKAARRSGTLRPMSARDRLAHAADIVGHLAPVRSR